MKACLVVLLILASLAPAWSQGDPVDRLVSRLSGSHGLWVNGLSPTLGLPATAATPEVVAKVLATVGFERGHVRTHRIVAVRDITISNSGSYTAVTVDTDLGKKIVLLQFQPSIGWWSRVFEATD